MTKRLIAPSILSADFARLGEEIHAVAKAGADLIHLDVMDGHFVPNITIGPPVVAAVRAITRLSLDCHLMIERPERHLEAFAKAGADWISVHAEACDLAKVLPEIRRLGKRAGCVLNPETSASALFPYLSLADFVLVMSVHPGFGGQVLIEGCVEKIAKIHQAIGEQGLAIPVEVDGGINPKTVKRAVLAGASIIVAGSAIFGAEDYAKAIAELRRS